MRTRILLYLIVAMIATAGTSIAYDGNLWDADGIGPAPNPLVLQPGDNITLSYYMENLYGPDINQSFEYNYTVTVIAGATAVPGDITVTLSASVTPTSSPYIDLAVINIEKSADAPLDGKYRVQISAGGESVEIDTATRTIEVPEFPTVALPIAAIIGLAFFIHRRRDE